MPENTGRWQSGNLTIFHALRKLPEFWLRAVWEAVSVLSWGAWRAVWRDMPRERSAGKLGKSRANKLFGQDAHSFVSIR